MGLWKMLRVSPFVSSLFLFHVHWHLPVCSSGWVCWIPWKWGYRQLWAAVWMLGIDPVSFGRAAGAFNCWDTSLAPHVIFWESCSLSTGLTSWLWNSCNLPVSDSPALGLHMYRVMTNFMWVSGTWTGGLQSSAAGTSLLSCLPVLSQLWLQVWSKLWSILCHFLWVRGSG